MSSFAAPSVAPASSLARPATWWADTAPSQASMSRWAMPSSSSRGLRSGGRTGSFVFESRYAEPVVLVALRDES
eukprot:scaffold231037_cov33-Prasinocladus_malaysianus.AAC.1